MYGPRIEGLTFSQYRLTDAWLISDTNGRRCRDEERWVDNGRVLGKQNLCCVQIRLGINLIPSICIEEDRVQTECAVSDHLG